MPDLFEASVEIEVEKRVEAEIAKRLDDSHWLQERLARVLSQQEAAKPILERYARWLNTDGYLDVAQASDAIELYYVGPDNRQHRMGRNYFLRVLELDQVVVSTVGGYRLHSRFRQQLEGKAVVKVVARNDRTYTTVLFRPSGIEWLDIRYSRDTRLWHSTTDHTLYCEEHA